MASASLVSATPFANDSIAVAASRLAAHRFGQDRAISGRQVAVTVAAAAALWLITSTGAGAVLADTVSIGSADHLNQAMLGALKFDQLVGLVNTILR